MIENIRSILNAQCFLHKILIADSFKLQALAGNPRMELLLATEGNSIVAIGSGSSVKFTNFDNMNTFTMKPVLTDSVDTFYIRLSDDTADQGMCLKGNGAALGECIQADNWFL